MGRHGSKCTCTAAEAASQRDSKLGHLFRCVQGCCVEGEGYAVHCCFKRRHGSKCTCAEAAAAATENEADKSHMFLSCTYLYVSFVQLFEEGSDAVRHCRVSWHGSKSSCTAAAARQAELTSYHHYLCAQQQQMEGSDVCKGDMLSAV
jgi:hypothetical protein